MSFQEGEVRRTYAREAIDHLLPSPVVCFVFPSFERACFGPLFRLNGLGSRPRDDSLSV